MIELKGTQANITLKSPTVVSGSVDLSNYYTKTEVDSLIPDTSGFALKSEIPDVSEFITEIPAEYVTETELNAKIPEATAANKGQVLSVDADGNKTWANPYAIDGTLTPGYQYNSAAKSHLFVIDATNSTPALGTYYFNSGTVYIKVVKDGVKVSQQSFAAVKQIQVININPSGKKSGIVFDIIYVSTKQRVNLYFEDNGYVIGGTYTANTFYKTTLQYSSKEVDNLLNQKLDSPTNTGTTGQVPVYQEDGSTVWGDVLTQVDIDAKGYQTAEQVQAAINTALGVIENGTY